MRNSNLLSLAALAVGLSLAQANASIITINSGNAPAPNNGGKATIEAWLGAGVTAYNAANNPDLPTPGLEQFRVNTGDVPANSAYPQFGNDTLSITIPTGGYNYIALHWGGQGGGVYQSFYIGTIGGAVPSTVTFTSPNDKNGLSWYDTFSKVQSTTVVPEPSTYIAGGLLLIPILSQVRRLKRSA